ncbi:methyltransferase domain-containing protein [Candidatus Woesearchaeota archaeon]|nr:methyltransferase domain-containing protein [Candidatus Woesearchaeota archaeon]
MDYKQPTMDSYNQNAELLAAKFGRLTDLSRRTEFPRFMELIPGKRVLDLGCGAGDHAAYFQSQGLEVTCVDLSDEMVRLCREKGLDARVMDIENLTFDDGSFDGVWAVTSLLHIPKQRLPAVISQLYGITKDDGMLYVCVKEGDGERMVPDKFANTERFFSFWKEKELNGIIAPYFSPIETCHVDVKGTVFLQTFYRRNSL